ncbi:MAG: hypothetical protein COB36_10615 [Alphaproteobacteria bacterium]|nr:MAG: hypothetical protein COB36_10615 [Alphaproteobacteria bacterium]
MRNTIILCVVLAFFMNMARGDVEQTWPQLIVADESGVAIEGVSKSVSQVNALEKVLNLPCGTHKIIRPDATIITSCAVVDPDPDPTPDPIPDPIPDPDPCNPDGSENCGENPVPVPDPTESVAYTQKNLAGCIDTLGAAGGWCKMEVSVDDPSISSVYPAKLARHYGRQGSTLNAWCGAAFDEADKVLYFTCGGHADYPGNEVYSFNLMAGKWERLTNPSPLDYVTYNGPIKTRYIWTPDLRKVPSASHTYDGLVYRPDTGTILYTMRRPSNGARVTTGEDDTSPLFVLSVAEPQVYEFNPSKVDTRNGLAPLSWRLLGGAPFSYLKATMLPDASVLVDSKTRLYRVTFPDNVFSYSELARHADYGDGNMIYDPSRDLAWIVSRHDVRSINPVTGAKVHGFLIEPSLSGKSLALDADNNIVMWDGCTKVSTYNPETDELTTQDWGLSGPAKCLSSGRIYSKWVHLGDNVFAGVRNEDQPVWIYKHGQAPALPVGQVVNTPSTELFHASFDTDDWFLDFQKSGNDGPQTRLDGSRYLNDASIVSEGCVAGGCLKIDFQSLECCGIAIHYDIPGEQQNAIVEYWLKLAPNFRSEIYDDTGIRSGSGGKLPGLADISQYPLDQCGNGGASADGIECWSARTKFGNCNGAPSCTGTNKTRIGAYIYSAENQNITGDVGYFDGDSTSTGYLNRGIGTHGQLEPDRWYKIKIQVAMNTPDVHDGVYRAWIDDVLAYDKTDMLWRYSGHENLHVSTFWMNAMFGGSGVGPLEDTYIMIDELRIFGED